MDKKFMVSYEINYVHRVSLGITAADPHLARQFAEQAFSNATIWDNTPAMPLLSDEYYESGDESLDWDCVEVEQLPEPDFSVEQIQRQQMAFLVCRGLVEAFEQAGLVTGATSSDDLDNLLNWAKQALPSNSE